MNSLSVVWRDVLNWDKLFCSKLYIQNTRNNIFADSVIKQLLKSNKSTEEFRKYMETVIYKHYIHHHWLYFM